MEDGKEITAIDVLRRWDELQQDEFRDGLDGLAGAIEEEESYQVANALRKILKVGERCYKAKYSNSNVYQK